VPVTGVPPVRPRPARRGPSRPATAAIAGLAALLGVGARPVQAESDVHQQVTVAVLRDAAPYSYQGADGNWQGLAVEMWNVVADAVHLDARFEGLDPDGVFDAVASGRARFGIGPLSITAQRLQRVDFSVPIDSTGIAIAVPRTERSMGRVLRDALLSSTFLRLAAGVLGLLALVGTLFWIVERRHNKDFRGRHIHGWGTGLWLSIVTMTTVGYGVRAPKTLSGRVLAALWMFISLVLISIFTGTVATLLTAERLGPRIEGFADLGGARVACVAESAAAELVAELHMTCRSFPGIDQALGALVDGKADAAVYDHALLAWSLKQNPDLPINIVPGTLRREFYGFAMQPGEALRRPINEAIALALDSPRWSQLRLAVLGANADR